MNFSSRTSWSRQPNQLAQALEERRSRGARIDDLTVSNPTMCGIHYPEAELLTALSQRASLLYQPNPHGLLSAREAIVQYYQGKSLRVDPSNLFLTASTSEAYSLVFKLLCDADDHILFPRPSYPLFEYLAQINDVAVDHYHLLYDHGWRIDLDSMRKGITSSTRAIVLVHPHNPTGMWLKKNELDTIIMLAQEHNLALIVDEVFIEIGRASCRERVYVLV